MFTAGQFARCPALNKPPALPLENLTLVSSFHWVFELSLDKLKTMLQAKFGGGGHKLSVKVLTLNLYPMVSGGITPYLAVRFLKHHILHDDVFDKRETLRNSSL